MIKQRIDAAHPNEDVLQLIIYLLYLEKKLEEKEDAEQHARWGALD